MIFATGTPVSNSMTELYTMQRYLQYERLQELNMTHFDCWASRFGETVTALELAPEGTGYRARTRFSKFFNLPELMNLFKEVADIKTADQLNLPTPEVEYHNIVAQPTEHQQEMVKALSERASLVHSGTVDPSQDNMLKITSDGRKLGLDQRIVNQMLPDEPGTKVNQCVDNIMQIWRDGKADKLTQLVFCDISTPQAKAPASKAAKTLDNPLLHALEGAVPLPEQEPVFTVYDDIRQKLIAQGMPADQIAFIHEANTEVRKKELFSKVRTGQVRVLLGSTAKMGAGTNVQDRLVALHDLDCPWRPGDLVRPDPEGGYEIISGHRRHRASELAGLEDMPVIIREMNDEEAVIEMVDANIQREDVLPSEKAWAYRMKLEAIKRQGERTDLTSAQVGPKLTAAEKIAENSPDSKSQVKRYIRLTELIPELLDMVDEKKIALNPAYELSFLKKEEQVDLLDAMDSEQATPSLSQAQRLKKFSQEGHLSIDVMRAIMGEEKKSDLDRVTFTSDTLRKYFPKSYTPARMQETIIKLLEQWQKKRQRDQER